MKKFEVTKRKDLPYTGGIYILFFSDNTFFIGATENLQRQIGKEYCDIVTSEFGWRHDIKKIIRSHHLYYIRGYKYCWACCTRILIAPYNSSLAAQEDLDIWLEQSSLKRISKKENYFKVNSDIEPFLNTKELFSK